MPDRLVRVLWPGGGVEGGSGPPASGQGSRSSLRKGLDPAPVGSLTAGVGAEAPRSAVRREIEGARQLAHWLARATSVAGPDMAVDDTTLSSRATGSVCAHFSVGEGVGITLRCAAPYFPLWLTFATSSTLMSSAYGRS